MFNTIAVRISLKAFFWFCFAMAATFLCSCGGGDKKPSANAKELDSLLNALDAEDMPPAVLEETGSPAPSGPPARLTMLDDKDYSPAFLTKLATFGLAKNIELADSFLILEKRDTFVFPMEIPLGEWTNFMAVKKGVAYSLDLSKVNFTSLEFNFELRKAGQTLDQLTGRADLSPGFLLGNELDEDDQTGTVYPANEYVFENENCLLSIRLGNDEGIQKVKIIKNCKSGKYDIALEDCPVLLEKR